MVSTPLSNKEVHQLRRPRRPQVLVQRLQHRLGLITTQLLNWNIGSLLEMATMLICCRSTWMNIRMGNLHYWQDWRSRNYKPQNSRIGQIRNEIHLPVRGWLSCTEERGRDLWSNVSVWLYLYVYQSCSAQMLLQVTSNCVLFQNSICQTVRSKRSNQFCKVPMLTSKLKVCCPTPAQRSVTK